METTRPKNALAGQKPAPGFFCENRPKPRPALLPQTLGTHLEGATYIYKITSGYTDAPVSAADKKLPNVYIFMASDAASLPATNADKRTTETVLKDRAAAANEFLGTTKMTVKTFEDKKGFATLGSTVEDGSIVYVASHGVGLNEFYYGKQDKLMSMKGAEYKFTFSKGRGTVADAISERGLRDLFPSEGNYTVKAFFCSADGQTNWMRMPSSAFSDLGINVNGQKDVPIYKK